MVVKAGQVAVLHLGPAFASPRWREAVVLHTEGEWTKTLVRCSTEELEQTELSSLTHEGVPYCLVEAKAHQLRFAAEEEVLTLDVDPKVLATRAKTLLESDEELLYATASDPGAKQGAKIKSKFKKKKAEKSDSSSGYSSQAEVEDPLLQLRRSWLGSGTRTENPKEKSSKASKKERFSMIARKRRKIPKRRWTWRRTQPIRCWRRPCSQRTR